MHPISSLLTGLSCALLLSSFFLPPVYSFCMTSGHSEFQYDCHFCRYNPLMAIYCLHVKSKVLSMSHLVIPGKTPTNSLETAKGGTSHSHNIILCSNITKILKPKHPACLYGPVPSLLWFLSIFPFFNWSLVIFQY